MRRVKQWKDYKGYIIGFDYVRNYYAVWAKEPDWKDCNPIGTYHLTIEQAKGEIDLL